MDRLMVSAGQLEELQSHYKLSCLQEEDALSLIFL
jgi:hypothetical protein